jgi:hypothetical protein
MAIRKHNRENRIKKEAGCERADKEKCLIATHKS